MLFGTFSAFYGLFTAQLGFITQGLKKVWPGSLGQENFLIGQLTFKAYLPHDLLSSNKIINWDQQEVALGKQFEKAACPVDIKLEFK